MPLQSAGHEGGNTLRFIKSPKRRWIGNGLNRRLVACDDLDTDDVQSSPESPCKPDPAPWNPVREWNHMKPVPQPSMPKSHGELYRKPMAADDILLPNKAPPSQSKTSSHRRSRTLGPPSSPPHERPLTLTKPKPFHQPATVPRSLASPPADGGWRVRKTSPPRHGNAQAKPWSIPRHRSTEEISSMASSNRLTKHSPKRTDPFDTSINIYQRPKLSSSSRSPGPPSTIASSTKHGYQGESGSDMGVIVRPPPSITSSSYIRRTWAKEGARIPRQQVPSNVSSQRRKWNTTWTQELDDHIAHQVTSDIDSPSGLVRRVPFSPESQLIRRIPFEERYCALGPSPPRPGLMLNDLESASLRSYDRRSNKSAGALVKYHPRGDVSSKKSWQGSVTSQRKKEYLSPPVPDHFAWTNEKACSLVQETKQAKGLVVRARSPIRDKEDNEGANFCDVCGAEYLRSKSQFCSECGSERVAVRWTGRDR